MQELDSQRGEEAYFQMGAYFRGNTVLPYITFHDRINKNSIILRA